MPSVSTQELRRTPLFPIHRYYTGQLYFDGAATLTGTSGTVASYVFIANGLYDPNVTGTGHQPMGFDQMMAIYEQYTVVRSTITVEFNNTSTFPVRAYLYLAPDTTALTNTAGIVENGLVKHVSLAAAGTAGCLKRLSLNCDVARYFGRRSQRELLDDVNLFGTAAANPTEGVYFVIAIQDFNASATATVNILPEISYDSIYWEPRKLSPS